MGNAEKTGKENPPSQPEQDGMSISPSANILQQILMEALSRQRLHIGHSEQQLTGEIRDLPNMLRNWAEQLENPPKDSEVMEAPGLEGYSLWANTYDTGRNEVILAEEKVIGSLIGDIRGKRVLDVGCGTGRHAIPLAQKGATVVASEPTESMIEVARAKATANQVNITWRKETIDSLPVELGRFDLVLCCLVLSHIQNFREAIAKLTAHVEPGGSLILSDFHPFCLLLGLRSHCYSGGRKILVPNFVRLPSEYIAALLDKKMEIINFLEPANIPELPGIPTTLVIKATAKEK